MLESIFEQDFSDRSIGYRKGKPGARESGRQLTRDLDSGTYRWIVEADIKSFFDDVDHDWLVRMLEQRINDRAFTGLIVKWLKAGVLEPGEEHPKRPDSGTPQGGIISPALANIYLHYVLDLWIERVISKGKPGQSDLHEGCRRCDRWIRIQSDVTTTSRTSCEAGEIFVKLG
ncbi:MAG: reverse transcriptase domain-containing protein [Verrucomicrobiales bacterium]